MIKRQPEDLDEETLKRYRSALAALNKFNASIAFYELTEDVFQEVKKYFSKDLRLAGSTIIGYFNAFKKVLAWARKEGHITKEHQESLFGDVRIPRGKAKKDHLEVEEILQWKNTKMTGKKHP